MSWEYELLREDVRDQKQLLIGVSRGLRDLQQTAKGRHAKSVAEKGVPSTPLLIRIAVANLVARAKGQEPAEAAERLYGAASDVAAAVTRAAVNPSMTTVVGNAAELVGSSNTNLLPALVPQSGYAQLSTRVLHVDLSGIVKIPLRSDSILLPAKFIGQGEPIPVGKLGLTSVTLTTYKLGVICSFSEEVANRSVPSIEAIIRSAMAEDAGKYLDSIVFGTAAGSATVPPGIFNGVTSTTGTAGGGQAALSKDIGTLLAAISPATDPVLVGNASTIARLSVWAPALMIPVIVSTGMADNALGAIDASALAFGDGPSRIDAGVDAVLHNEDTSPLPIGSGTQGAGVLAVPSTSLYQSDLLALRLLTFTSWAWRAQNAVALITGVSW